MSGRLAAIEPERPAVSAAHAAWIAAWLAANDPYGACREACDAMLLAFPALRLVRGHYQCPLWGDREHWWLVDPGGAIVDPTAAQFPTKGHAQYVEWDESQPEPTGQCPNCGDLCYEGNYCCSKACERAYTAYVSRGL